MITIITPFFTRNRDDYLYERARQFIRFESSAEGIHRIIVDFGSPSFISDEMEQLCAGHGMKFIRMERTGEPFSSGVCRNVGVQHARTEFISFQDIDLSAPESFYTRLIEHVRRAPQYFNHLECIPCLYLTKEGTKEYEAQDQEAASATFMNYFRESDSTRVQMYAPATSSIIARRAFYLAMGGMRDEFFGHGYEDFEMMNRLAWKANRFVRSHDYYSHAYKYSSLEYKGYRSFFSLFGRANMAAGLFFCHLYHPTPSAQGYAKRNAANRTLFEHFVKVLDKDGELPPPLSDSQNEVTTLALAGRNSIAMKSIRMAIPYFGNVRYAEETAFSDSDELVEYVKRQGISQVLFLTPYGNEHRLELYRACQAHKIPFVVFDRGALPNSWFFDGHGFNADSSSYDRSMWDKELSTEQREAIELYINDLTSSETALEENGERIGVYGLRNKYQLHGKKILFVPLQRPGDSVIRYFAGDAESIEDFCGFVSRLSLLLGDEWRVLVKKHPLESSIPAVPGAIVVSDRTHVNDLLAASDAVLVINSGVGLLATFFGKPTFNLGNAFYSHQGLSEQVTSVAQAAVKIMAGKAPLRQSVLRFAHYLVNDFYSFAATHYKKVADGDGFRSVAVNLDFRVLRLPRREEIIFQMRQEPLKKSSPLYDFYRHYVSNMGAPLSNLETAPAPIPFKETPAFVPEVTAAPVAPVEIVPPPVIPMATPPVSPALPMVPALAEPKRNQGKLERKLKKLMKYPHRFFADALRNRVA